MRKIITSILASCGLLVLALPASAQVTTMGPVDCMICNPNCTFPEEHTDFSYPLGLWWTSPAHGGCFWATCEDMHQRCNQSASAEDLERQDRISEILSTLGGDERVVALVDEFPEHVHLTTGRDALEVLGAACDEAKVLGRLSVTMSQAVAVIDAKSSYLASK